MLHYLFFDESYPSNESPTVVMAAWGVEQPCLNRATDTFSSLFLNEPIGALAHLQLGRIYAMQGDTAKARAAYEDFLTLWKDADPHIPIFKQAKAEYAML